VFIRKTLANFGIFVENSEMIDKRYQLTFTDTTQIVVDRLINHGFNIRDILNAGVILFDKAPLKERGMAIAAAKTRQKQELNDVVATLLKIDLDYLDDDGKEKVAALRRALDPDCAESEAGGQHKKIS